MLGLCHSRPSAVVANQTFLRPAFISSSRQKAKGPFPCPELQPSPGYIETTSEARKNRPTARPNSRIYKGSEDVIFWRQRPPHYASPLLPSPARPLLCPCSRSRNHSASPIPPNASKASRVTSAMIPQTLMTAFLSVSPPSQWVGHRFSSAPDATTPAKLAHNAAAVVNHIDLKPGVVQVAASFAPSAQQPLLTPPHSLKKAANYYEIDICVEPSFILVFIGLRRRFPALSPPALPVCRSNPPCHLPSFPRIFRRGPLAGHISSDWGRGWWVLFLSRNSCACVCV
jgi:hypothetical protein